MNEFKINIIRVWSQDKSIMGELYVNGNITAMTLELPWRDNKQCYSSIPEGKYGAIIRYDKQRDDFFTIELTGTEPRSGIQIHVGNYPDNSIGCILVGLSAKFHLQEIGRSKEAIENLKKLFYGSDTPNSTPDISISVNIESIPHSLWFYPSMTGPSFHWIYDNGYWEGVGIENPARYKEVFRDLKWIISKSSEEGSFRGRYVRWGTLGNTPFQISKDLINWKTISPEELIKREPTPNILLWNTLFNRGVTLKNFICNIKSESKPNDLNYRPFNAHDGDGYGDEDGKEDGRVTYNFDDEDSPGYEGDEEVTIDLNDTDTRDDYSGYDDGFDDRGD